MGKKYSELRGAESAGFPRADRSLHRYCIKPARPSAGCGRV